MRALMMVGVLLVGAAVAQAQPAPVISVAVTYLDVTPGQENQLVREPEVEYTVRSLVKYVPSLTEAHSYAKTVMSDGLTVGPDGSAAIIPPRLVLKAQVMKVSPGMVYKP